MGVNPENVRVGKTGAVSLGAYNATPPSSANSVIVPTFRDLGAIDEENGVTKTLPNGGDATPIKAWQNGATVRTIRTTSDDLPTWQFTCLETNVDVIEFYYGVTVGLDGSFTWVNQLRTPVALVLDVIDGTYVERDFIPRAIVSEVAEVQIANTSAIGYQITVEAELHPTLGYNFKSWKTFADDSSSSS